MKTIIKRFSYSLFVAVIALAGCGGGQSGSKLVGDAVPASNAHVATPSAPGHGKIIPVCPDRRPGEMQCSALILDGTPERDGGTGPNGGFAPADLQAAYNLPSSSMGSGQIVAIVDPFDDPNVASDLDYYRSYFGLSAASFYKFNQYGQQYNYPRSCSYNLACEELTLDPQMVSASCPNCTIYLVEANSNKIADLDDAEAEAVKLGAHIVNNSWGCYGEGCHRVKQSYYDAPGVVYLGAAGDTGYGPRLPANFGSVVSVGGTYLKRGGGKRGWTESAWGGAGFGPWGTGGGCSTEPKPSWQHDPGCKFRTANDVAAVANPMTGVAVYDTSGNYDGWIIVGGDSVSTPLIAGVFGLAGNATSQKGGKTFWERRHEGRDDLNHITRGSNGHCSPPYLYLCADGTHEYRDYGGPTGWGTPNGIGAF